MGADSFNKLQKVCFCFKLLHGGGGGGRISSSLRPFYPTSILGVSSTYLNYFLAFIRVLILTNVGLMYPRMLFVPDLKVFIFLVFFCCTLLSSSAILVACCPWLASCPVINEVSSWCAEDAHVAVVSSEILSLAHGTYFMEPCRV